MSLFLWIHICPFHVVHLCLCFLLLIYCVPCFCLVLISVVCSVHLYMFSIVVLCISGEGWGGGTGKTNHASLSDHLPMTMCADSRLTGRHTLQSSHTCRTCRTYWTCRNSLDLRDGLQPPQTCWACWTCWTFGLTGLAGLERCAAVSADLLDWPWAATSTDLLGLLDLPFLWTYWTCWT